MIENLNEEENEYSDESNNYSVEFENDEIKLFIETQFYEAKYSENVILELQKVIEICKENPLEGKDYEYQCYEYITIYAFKNKNLELYLLYFKNLFELYKISNYDNKEKSLRKIFNDIDMNLNTLYDFINDSLNILEKLNLLNLRSQILDIIKENKIPIEIEENTPYDLIIYPNNPNLQYKNINSDINIKYKYESYSKNIITNYSIDSITFLGETIAIETFNKIFFYKFEDNNKKYIDEENLIQIIPKTEDINNIELIDDDFGFYVTNTQISFFNLKNKNQCFNFLKFTFIYYAQHSKDKNIFCLNGYFKNIKLHNILTILSPQQQFKNYQIQTQIELTFDLNYIKIEKFYISHFFKYSNFLQIFSEKNEEHNQIKVYFDNNELFSFNRKLYYLLKDYHNIIKVIELENFYVIQVFKNIFIFQKNTFDYFQSEDILNEIYGGKNDTIIVIQSFNLYIIYKCHLNHISMISQILYNSLNISFYNSLNNLNESDNLLRCDNYFKKNNFLYAYNVKKIKYNIILEKIKINLKSN